MAKRHKPEEIIAKLRQVDVMTPQGTTVADASRSIGMTEVTCHRWRQGYGGLESDQVRRMDALSLEKQRLPKAVADLATQALPLRLPVATVTPSTCDATGREARRSGPGGYRELMPKGSPELPTHINIWLTKCVMYICTSTRAFA